MSEKTGGPAFPFVIPPEHSYATGITARDYFAAKAMQGICASNPTIEWSNDRIASEAYDLADAMVKAREA